VFSEWQELGAYDIAQKWFYDNPLIYVTPRVQENVVFCYDIDLRVIAEEE
jgi:hypothetical protein